MPCLRTQWRALPLTTMLHTVLVEKVDLWTKPVTLLPLTNSGVFGSQLLIGPLNTIGSLAVVQLVFGILFIFIQNWLVLRSIRKQKGATTPATIQQEEENISGRRSLLRNGLVVLGLGALGVLAWRFISGGSRASSPFSSAVLPRGNNKITPPLHPPY